MKKIWVVLILLGTASPLFAEDAMKFDYEATGKPFSWEEGGKMQGILVDIAEEIIHSRMGLKIVHQGHPWKRSQHLVQIGEADALITNGPMRKDWADHSREVVLTLQHKLYVKAGGPKFDQLRKVHDLDDLKPFAMVDHRGSAWAEKNLAGRGIDVHWVADHDTMYRLVAKGRVDAVAYIGFVARYHIKNLGLQDQLVELPLRVPAVPFHIVIGKKSPFVKFLPQIDETIRQIKQDGTLQRIYDKYR